jgi:ribose transport system substrate-binding protein
MIFAATVFAIVMAACGQASSLAAKPHSASSGLPYAKQQLASYTGLTKTYPSPGPALNAKRVRALKGKTVLFVPLGLLPVFTEQQASLKVALGHLGIKLTTCDPNFVPSAAVTCMLNAKTDKAAAVITSAIPYSLAANAYQKLESERVPVLVGAAGPGNPANTKDIAFVADTTYEAKFGDLAVDDLAVQAHGKADVLFVSVSDSTTLTYQANQMSSEFKKVCAGCKVTNIPFNTTNLSQLPSAVDSQLVSDPSTNYILDQTDAYVQPTLAGIQTANASSRVTGVTGTGTPGALTLIKEHQFLTADVGYDFSYIGWDEADGILRLLTGVPVSTQPFVPIRVFDAANVGSLNLSANANVSAYYGSYRYVNMFYRNWAGK